MTKTAYRTDLKTLRRKLLEEQSRLERLLREVEVALGTGSTMKDAAPPRPGPLDTLKEVLEATQDLRMPSGKLSAERIAALFGVSLSHLSGWLGKSRQAVSKTPDADSLQSALAYFERVARLRLALKTDDAFRKWLRTPHDLLDQESPLDVMGKGEWQVMADFVDDMLTGAPS